MQDASKLQAEAVDADAAVARVSKKLLDAQTTADQAAKDLEEVRHLE